ncbi:L-methionine sulfoximine/L-methionine sulfone acetyltransferase [bioreactor metagenome]|uniref:L-methionine sulfoximine/L-methionine sulfone acetyltransferase n=1 Tax=bioreactor metagenome TaxID=1076179 RepID=A0A645BS32_9ZZZZ|nr:N-acetyltransferase family protein [Candidatus Metalachnospira sp.]
MIRDMKPDDWGRITAIYQQGLDRGISTFNTVCPSYQEWDKSHIKECRYVYEKSGIVVGWVAISPTSPRYAYRGSVEVSIYIDDTFRGKGIGTELLKKLDEESEKAGYWSIYSAIFSINEASIALHRKCGFREIGYREKIAKDRFGRWQNTILMEKRNNIE